MNFGDTNLQSVISGVVVLRLDKINFTVRNTSKDKFDSDSEESACNAVDLGSIPGLGRSPGEGKVYPLQYSGLKNSHSPWGHKESDMTERLHLGFPVAQMVKHLPAMRETWD